MPASAAAMAERFKSLFVRTLRMLRDLRRYAPAIHIEHAGQVNVAQGQQLNLAATGPEDSAAELGASLPIQLAAPSRRVAQPEG